MATQFFFTPTKFSSRRVAREIGQALGRTLPYQEAEDDENLDGSIDVTDRVHVQVGADYLIVSAWKDSQTLVSWPPRTSLQQALTDLRTALHTYPEAAP